jgi:thiamine transport system ATP-binding protein
MLSIIDVHKSFADKKALEGFSLELTKGEIVALLGPSGSGKSTLLKVISGLEDPDQGEIIWAGRNLQGVPTHERGIGYMFQDYALFPHRNVAGNVAFGLEMTGVSEAKKKNRVAEILKLVSLDGFEKRSVDSLSGGEQQRVALARALAAKPKLLLLDEPLGSLDRALREELGSDLARILRASQQSSIYVTHDQEEAYAIADRIVLLNEGRIAQVGSPRELYQSPRSKFVAKFLGLENIFPAQIRIEGKRNLARTALGDFPVSWETPEGKAALLIRPDRILLDAKGKVKMKGRLLRITFRGRYSELEIEIKGASLFVQNSAGTVDLIEGDEINISFDPIECVQVLSID